MSKALICGAFDFVNKSSDGQTVKTRALYYGLKEKLGDTEVEYVETIGWKKHPLSLILDFFKKAKNSKNIIMLPAQNGVYVFSRLLNTSKILFKNRIFYDVIGGWLPDITKSNRILLNALKNFDDIWVETNMLATSLKEQGFNNVSIIRNFKDLKPINICDIKTDKKDYLRLCTFSRVMKEKGIEDAINVIEELNNFGLSIELDIYGIVDRNYFDEFSEIKNQLPSYIRYKGAVDSNESTSVLKNYDTLLFPTRFKTEGLPGTIIDAYAAGIPVISAKWDSFDDIVEDGKTGIGFVQYDINDLKEKIKWAYDNKDDLYKMRINCINKYSEFDKDKILSEITNRLQ